MTRQGTNAHTQRATMPARPGTAAYHCRRRPRWAPWGGTRPRSRSPLCPGSLYSIRREATSHTYTILSALPAVTCMQVGPFCKPPKASEVEGMVAGSRLPARISSTCTPCLCAWDARAAEGMCWLVGMQAVGRDSARKSMRNLKAGSGHPPWCRPATSRTSAGSSRSCACAP